MKGLGLEELREIFKDPRTHIAVAKILKLSLVEDRSCLKALVSVFPEQREVVVRMAWEMTGPDSGIIEFPAVNDLVLVGFADGDNDTGFIIRRLTSKEDKIPVNAEEGHLVVKSKEGKKIWLTSSGNIFLSKGDGAPTENLVLGQQLKTLLAAMLSEMKAMADKIATHNHPGNLGYPTGAPNQAADFQELASKFDNLKSSPVEDEKILSNLAFTEKGS